jgi:hypothetical protein
MHFIRQSPIAFAVLLVVGACMGGKDIFGSEPETGEGLVYPLVAHNTRNVPIVLTSGPPRIELLRGALTLSTDSTWILSQVFKVTQQGEGLSQTVTARGVYTRTDAVIALRLEGDTVTQYNGSWTPNVVQLTGRASEQGTVLGFQK